MATWYVRPDTSHNATRDGTTYAKAWGGWSEIVWGSLGVYGTNSDTLYVCGAHSYGAVTSVGAHGATAGQRVTIRGDYATSPGSISITAGAYYFNPNKNYTTITNLTVTAGDNRAVVPTGVPLTGLWIKNCIINGSTGAPCLEFLTPNTFAHVDCVIDQNTFNGGGGGGGGGIHWSPSTSVACYLNGLQITRNTFNNCGGTRGTIVLKPIGVFGGTAPQATTKLADIDIHGNTFNNCVGVVAEVYGPEITGRNTGLKIYSNTVNNQMLGSTGLGGGFALGGFGSSLTSDFGPNVVYANKCYGLIGPTGFANPMYGSYNLFNNYAEDISTTTIDGCGILFDHGADGCVAFGNEFHRITGNGVADYQSGAGIGIIYDATNITAFGNIVDGCVMGVWYANQTSGRVTNIFNNHFLNCSLVGFTGNNTTYPADNVAQNNHLSAANAIAAHIKYNSGAWVGDSHNRFVNFRGAASQAIHATSDTVDPILDADYRPTLPAAKRTGTYLGGKDNTGKQFYNPPNIGAVEDLTTTRRNLFRG